MSRFLTKAFYVCVLVIVCTLGQDQTCGFNEELVRCAHPDPTCARPFPNFCLLVCDPPACRCLRGHARNAFGYCVPFRQCPRPLRAEIVVPPCPRHERFVECSTPEGTCEDPQAKAMPMGHPKCQCLEGYVRHDGRCVSECPTRLKPVEGLDRVNVPAEDGWASTTTTTANARTLITDEESTDEPSSVLETGITDNSEQAQGVVPVVSEPETGGQTPPNVAVSPEVQEVVSESEAGDRTPPNVPVNPEAQQAVPVVSEPETGEQTPTNVPVNSEGQETSEAPPPIAVLPEAGGNEANTNQITENAAEEPTEVTPQAAT